MGIKLTERQIVLSSRNSEKIQEIRERLNSFDLDVLSVDQFLENDIEETGETFEENALLKAHAGAQASGLPTLGDDSGFCVQAMNGAPGLFSARFIKEQGGAEEAFAFIHDKVLQKNDRKALFVCVLALVWPDGHEEVIRGEVSGQVAFPPRGSLGFGFDPIFTPEGYHQTYAEMTKEEKSKVSHRGKALEELISRCLQGT